MSTGPSTPKAPTAFISYSWDSDEHKAWVKALAARLRANGVDVTLDRWAVAPGDQLPHFMETAVRENDFVLLVCTPPFKFKSDGRTGGVGYEGDIMTGEVLAGRDPRKFIPVLRSGTRHDATPSWLLGRYGVDLRGDPYAEVQYADVLNTLHGTREQAPPLGGHHAKAGGATVSFNVLVTPPRLSDPEPIKIEGIVVSEVGTPRNDNTRGCALYRVPFRLSRLPSSEWARLFVQTWDSPPSFTLMHRPGIASVEDDCIILDGTTVEEVEQYHRDTLKLVVERVNQLVADHEARQRRQEALKDEHLRQHKESVEDAAKRISFD